MYTWNYIITNGIAHVSSRRLAGIESTIINVLLHRQLLRMTLKWGISQRYGVSCNSKQLNVVYSQNSVVVYVIIVM